MVKTMAVEDTVGTGWNKGPLMIKVEDKNWKRLSSKPSIGHYSGDDDHFCLVARAA